MKSITKLCVCAATAATLACALPAHAGSWVLTSSYTKNVSTGNGWDTDSVTQNTSTSYGFTAHYGYSGGPENGEYTYYGSIQWVGGGTQPAYVTLTESSTSEAEALYSSTATQSANDGFSDPSVTTTGSSPYPWEDTTSSGNHTTQVAIAPGATYNFTRTLTATSSGAAINEGSASYSISIQ